MRIILLIILFFIHYFLSIKTYKKYQGKKLLFLYQFIQSNDTRANNRIPLYIFSYEETSIKKWGSDARELR